MDYDTEKEKAEQLFRATLGELATFPNKLVERYILPTTANQSALSEKAVSESSAMVSKESKPLSSPNGDFEQGDHFETSGPSVIAKEWMDYKRLDRNRDRDEDIKRTQHLDPWLKEELMKEELQRRQDLDAYLNNMQGPGLIPEHVIMKEELKKKKVKQRGRLK